MKRLLAVLALVLAAPAAAQDPPRLSIEQQTLLRCSAMFALVAGEQAKGDTLALGYPPLAERGREYFARTAARLTDELGVSRGVIADLMGREANRIQAERAAAASPGEITDRIMQSCLTSLVASGL